ncbi:hypothetical protein K788_00009640 (plasmid) [Paraburkholderia caribensis MBA4]|uniref:Uncharacterized protein n=1 Tax=Paraburkholderia caribensis MBA4 TaxID=1323664 RepID=A0A0P0RQN8_9BURK|nr:hypothetical protein [Paraburkholderia caribensis]ALL71363.1 hypothetical protein K788_00009640 [Paraburkholderia caribensis MBA4]
MKRQIVATLLGLVLTFQSGAQTSPPPLDDICLPAGYLIGYFNGVNNDVIDATIASNELRKIYGTTNPKDGQRIRYDYFLNPSQGFLQDVAESFKQKAQLHGDTPTIKDLAKKFEFFWALIGDVGPVDRTRIPGFASFPSDDVSVDFVKIAEDAISKAQPEAVVASMVNEVRPYVIEGTKLIMVAHSQGNLFATSVYNRLKPELKSTTSVQLVHVAPPDDKLIGPYTLHDRDRVINAVRQSAGHVPPANAFLPVFASVSDLILHFFVETYLNRSYPTFQHIKIAIDVALDTAREEPNPTNKGFFTITLTWDVPGDLDLHVVEPDGTHVYYAASQGRSGLLDRDDTRTTGPRNTTHLRASPANYRQALTT